MVRYPRRKTAQLQWLEDYIDWWLGLWGQFFRGLFGRRETPQAPAQTRVVQPAPSEYDALNGPPLSMELGHEHIYPKIVYEPATLLRAPAPGGQDDPSRARPQIRSGPDARPQLTYDPSASDARRPPG